MRYTTNIDGKSTQDGHQRFTYVNGVDVIGEFQIDDLPGNMEIAVSFGTYIHRNHRGKGLGQQQHKDRLKLITRAGYTAAICTVAAANAIEKHILQKNGWVKCWEFRNKDGDLCELWGHQEQE